MERLHKEKRIKLFEKSSLLSGFIFFILLVYSLNTVTAQEMDSNDYFNDEIYDVFSAIEDVKKFYFPYLLENGKITAISFTTSSTIVVNIDVEQKSSMTFVIPRLTLDSDIQGIPPDEFVFANGEEIPSKMSLTPEFRIFSFNVTEDFSELEFILTQVPESNTTFLEVDPNRIFSEILSPREQNDFGVIPSNVICNDDFQLVLKSTDSSAACVKPESIQKLIERGWAKP